MLGIKDPWIITVYILCILSALLCIIYGIRNWNKGAEKETTEIEEEGKWENNESEIEETL